MAVLGRTIIRLEMGLLKGEIGLEEMTSELADAFEGLKRINPQDDEVDNLLSNLDRAHRAISCIQERLLLLRQLNEAPQGSVKEPKSILDQNKLMAEEDDQDIGSDSEEEEGDSWQPLSEQTVLRYIHALDDERRTTESFEKAVVAAAAQVLAEATLERRRATPIRQNIAALTLMHLLRRVGIDYVTPSEGSLVSDFFHAVMVDIPLVKASDIALRQSSRIFRNLTTTEKLGTHRIAVVNHLDPEKSDPAFTYDLDALEGIFDEFRRSRVKPERIAQYAEELKERFQVKETPMFQASVRAEQFERVLNSRDPNWIIEEE
ncbi:hypothetical protein ACINK0_11425 [Deinococcus sp. VB343]|uniref:hypothetical protein n=1 Tax=Deinococcus sp. VB343 TaxID=3385567 RepID=UPI0039C96B78